MLEKHYLKRELYNLIKSEEIIFDFIQASSLDGLWYWDLENPEHEWMNPKFWTTLGYDPEEMPHRPEAWQDIIFPEDRDEALRRVQTHFADPDTPYDQILRYRHKNGSTVWIRCRGMAVRDENGTPVRMLGAHVDVTEMKAAEARERQNAESYRAILENQQTYIIKTDIQGDYTYANNFFLKTFVLENDAIMGASSMDSIYVEDHAKAIDTSIACMENPYQPIAVTLRKPMPDGSFQVTNWEFTGLTDEDGDVNEILCVGVDVTQQIKAEAALKASEAQFRFMAENTSDGIVTFNYNTISYLSPAYVQMFGYNLEQMQTLHQQDSFALVHPDDLTRVKNTFDAVFQRQQRTLTIEYRSKHQKGHYVWREDHITFLYGREGVPVQSIVVARDISERKQREAALSRLTTLLNDAQRIANMGGWELDVASGQMQWTDQVYDILEVNRDTDRDFVPNKHNMLTFYHPDDRSDMAFMLERTINDNLPFEITVRLLTAQGNLRWMRVSGYPMAEQKQITRVLGTIQDITEQKLLEERLRTSEQRLYSTLASIDDLVFVLDAEGVFQGAYQAQDNFYLPPQAFIGHAYNEILPAHVSNQLEAIYQQAQANTEDTFAFDYYLEDNGEVLWYSSKATARYDANGQFEGFTIVARDITERKRAENALRESKAQLDLFFNQSLTGFFFMMLDEPIDWDPCAQNDTLLEYVFDHQRVTKANYTFAEQYETTPEGLIGSTPRDMFAHDLVQGREVWRTLFDTGHLHVETEERRQDGSPVFIEGDYICLYDDQGRITGHFGVQQDVTSRKQAEIALEQSEAKFRSFVENANDLILTLNPQDEFAYISPMWEDVKGYSAQGLLGTSFVPLIHPEDIALALDAVNTVITSKETYNGLIYRFKHGDGSWHWFSANGAPILDELGNVVAILVTVRDITSDKAAEQAMQATLKKLEQALANNTLLMKEVHHRVKNNLAVIASLLSLQAHELQDASAKAALRESRERVTAMAEIHELMYRHDNTKSIVFDEYLRALTSRMERSFSYKKQQIRFVLETIPLELPFDQAIPLALIVNELLTNASKYAFPQDHPDACVHISLATDDNQLTLTIADNGVGLADEKSLETTDSLGMTVIHSLTEQLGGTVHFANQPDDTTGLQAVLRLPWTKQRSSRPHASVTAK